MAIEDDHQDVLQNIEFIVANQYKRHPEMTDVETLVRCLKRLLVSVKRWNKQNGQRGYLSFMTPFIK